MKKQMALAVSLKAVIMWLSTVVTEIRICGAAGFLRLSHSLLKWQAVDQSAQKKAITEEKAKNREEPRHREWRARAEIRRMLLCVIVRPNWHLGDLIRWQALH